ncbi:MAG: AprI/Inh family metalloprotease inhibitor [Alphaproteobacteria bacterium]|nr:AprI/Inh family metalloprotease inhibitor [Alphaproteobacteria bacterium]
MNALRSFLFTSLAVAAIVGTTAMAAPDAAGSWKLTVGNGAPCNLVLAPDGSAASSADCATGNRVARWRAVADKIELRTASGETVGILVARDGAFAGKRFSDGRTMVLSR